ncbi:fructoselysine 6-kinase, partial [Vibrio parahaemolyticus]|uniref:fructoselysine 6-kinase n=1 Tax=Vibrio parahaemolyticus TaxID=670 RepID=UPI00215BBDE2
MKLIALGSNCIDYYVNIENGKPYPGGGPVNMAVYVVRLGGCASYLGPVGDDEYGRYMIKKIEASGVNISHIQITPGMTALTEVKLIDNERIFGDYHEGVMNKYQISDEEIKYISTFDYAVCDVWGKPERYIEKISNIDIKIAFDCSTELDDQICNEVIPFCNYVFFSTEESNILTVKEKMSNIHSLGPDLIVAMRGENGSICYDGISFYEYGIVEVEEVIDTMGAGDSYISGFLYGLSQNLCILDCMELGARNASYTLTY